MIGLDIAIEAPGWGDLPDAEALCREAADAALRVAPRTGGDVTATLLLSDDATVAELNGQWRGKERPTNVLSFPTPPGAPAGPGAVRHLGDVVLAFETVAREAAEGGLSVEHHLAHLVVHGLLHLLGLDHETDREADAMEALEVAALARLGIADPYRDAA